MTVLPSENLLFAVTADNKLLGWDIDSGDIVYEKTVINIAAGVKAHPTEPWIFYAAEEGVILENVTTGEMVRTFDGQTEITSMDISSDGAWLLTGQRSGAFIWWDIESGEVLGQFDTEAGVVQGAFSPENDIIAIYSNAAGMQLWEAQPRTLSRMQNWLAENRYSRPITPEDCRQYVDLPDETCPDIDS